MATNPTSTARPLVHIDGLQKRYGPARPPAVAGVSFDIHEGEIFGLLGPNGAGKTTLISMLSCLLEPSAGDASVAGHSLQREAMAVKRLIGVVPQEIALYPALTARQNLRFWGQMYDLGGRELERRVDELLAQLGLSERGDERIDSYSGGMKRRVNIGVGLIHRPRLLFLDEPTVAIDPQSRRNILDLVKALNRDGVTVLYTTHYMEEAQELSDRIGIMDHGRLIALGTQAELLRQVGEVESLRLDVDGGDEGLMAALAALPGIAQVQQEEGQLLLLADDANARLPDVLRCLNQHGAHLSRIEVHAPNLEALFLHLTGRALRD